MVLSKSDRERQKHITDKCQTLIELLLKDEDNKYCVDCDAKGPRWASWNLGIFLCIRCAGIHRNLGVHISRVKSVNLDAWTPEQVAYVQRIGNSRARAIYEANLPDDFRRPQTDTALESLIRAKYEHKKYIAQDYVDPGPPEPAFNADEEIKRLKEQKRGKLTGSGGSKTMISVSDSFASSLSTPGSSTTSATSNTSGIVSDLTKGRTTSTTSSVSSSTIPQTPTSLADNSATSSSGQKPVTSGKSALDDLMDLDFSQKPDASSSNNNNNNNNSHMMMRSLSSAFAHSGSFDNSHFSQAFASLSQHQPPVQPQSSMLFNQPHQPQLQPQAQQSPNIASLADFGSSPFSGTQPAASLMATMSTLTPSKPVLPVVTSSTTPNASIVSASNNDKNVMNLLDL